MNENTETLYLPIRLSDESATALRQEAAKFGVTQEELASAILNSECPFDSMTDDERGAAALSQIKDLYPERWTPTLEEAFVTHGKALEETNVSARERFEDYLSGQITLVDLPPALVEFLRVTGRLYPELWEIYFREHVEHILNIDALREYIDGAFSFESPQERLAAFRLVEEALNKYLQTQAVPRRLTQ